ncbi:MAG TPA: cytidine deaminase [Syntrophomonadaceae bacterium]|nr:cytidine deaminase [Syntrophomonadaceae bacterium]
MGSVSDRELLERARKASRLAYSPYSGFSVGAAILSREGAVFTGCNVENASFGMTICAERVALFKGVAEGCREFEGLALWAPEPVWPCGACLQCLAEFAPEIRIIRQDEKGEMDELQLKDLLTSAFYLNCR